MKITFRKSSAIHHPLKNFTLRFLLTFPLSARHLSFLPILEIFQLPWKKGEKDTVLSVSKFQRFPKLFKWQQLWWLPVVKICSIFFQLNPTLFTGVIAPNTPQNGPHWVLNQKKVLLDKVDNNKYPENDNWHPEGIDGWSYYRLCENFWTHFGVLPDGNLDPIYPLPLSPHGNFFCLILQELCDCFGTWGLRYLIFLRMQFLQKFIVPSNIVGFPVVNRASQLSKIVNLGWIPLEPKYAKFWRIFQTVFVLLDTTSNQNSEVVQKTMNNFNFTTTNAILIKLNTNMYPNKVLHLAKSWCVTHRVYDGVNKKPPKMSQKNQGLFGTNFIIS